MVTGFGRWRFYVVVGFNVERGLNVRLECAQDTGLAEKSDAVLRDVTERISCWVIVLWNRPSVVSQDWTRPGSHRERESDCSGQRPRTNGA